MSKERIPEGFYEKKVPAIIPRLFGGAFGVAEIALGGFLAKEGVLAPGIVFIVAGISSGVIFRAYENKLVYFAKKEPLSSSKSSSQKQQSI